ncbi:hypothetical protein [Sulfurimonas sp.]|uniref:hypothetical protein n=1 Tax=Sulfurimonas sp. TaxID=2022749 RepID=UPI003D097310
MMNNDNKISVETKLFGYIGEHAGVSRFCALINKLFKENSDDVMIIPMNIRPDDLYFTVSNMKNSHVNGAVISSEYVTEVVEILDDASSLVKRSGMCDIIYREENKLRGCLFSIRVLSEHLKDIYASKIAIIGTNHYSKAFSFLACGFNVSYFNDNLEELLTFTEEIEISDADINRIATGMEVDFSGFDAVLDFSEFNDLSMVTQLAKNNFDMKNTKQFSALKKRANELGNSYTSYDDLLEKLTNKAYSLIK